MKTLFLCLQLGILFLHCEHASGIQARPVNITFQKLEESDLLLVFEWVHKPFVKQWFEHEALEWPAFVERFHTFMESPTIYNFIMYDAERPFGYIRYYAAFEWPDGFGNYEPDGTYGIALYIGEPDYIGKGFGTALLRQFILKIMSDQKVLGNQIVMFIIDPDVQNIAAIRTYQKVGFTFRRLVDDPYWGMQYLMYLDPKDFKAC